MSAALVPQEARRQLRVAAVLVVLPSIGYYARSHPPTATDLPTTLGAALALLGVITAITLWRAEPICRKLFVLWCSLAAAAVVYPQLPLPGDYLWSAIVAVLCWTLLAVLARQVARGSRALLENGRSHV